MGDKKKQENSVESFIKEIEKIVEEKNGEKRKTFDNQKFENLYQEIKNKMQKKDGKNHVRKLKIYCEQEMTKSEVFNHAIMYASIAMTLFIGFLPNTDIENSINVPLFKYNLEITLDWIVNALLLIWVFTFCLIAILVIQVKNLLRSKTLILGVIEICEEEYKNSLEEEQRNLCVQDEQSKQSKLQKNTGKKNKKLKRTQKKHK